MSLTFYAPLNKKVGVKDVSKNHYPIKVYVAGTNDTEYNQNLINWNDEKFPE